MNDRELLQEEYKINRELLMIARHTLVLLEQKEVAYPYLSIPTDLQINLEEQRRKVAELIDKVNKIKDQLNGKIIESTETLMKPSGQGVIQVEKNEIINYDFVPLVHKLNEVFDSFGKKGALAFKVRLNNQTILEEYVIPRIKNELEIILTRIDRHRKWEEAKDIVILQYDLEACGNRTERLVENVFLNTYKYYHNLTDWIDDSNNDLILIVQNPYISDEMQIEEITEQCWQRIHRKVSPLLSAKRRFLVTIFAHSFPQVQPYSNDSNDELDEHKIIPLPLKKFEVDNLENWLRDELQEWGLKTENEEDRKQIEDWVKNIKKHRGDVSETFKEIRTICWILKKRRRISYNAK